MGEMDFTRKFSLGDQRDLEIKTILSTVYQALQEKGYHVLASRVPERRVTGEGLPVTGDGIRSYAFDYRRCADLSQCDGECFAIFGGEISRGKADSLFATDPRIRFVYVDFYE